MHLSNRRAAERFAELLDERTGGRRSHRHNAEDQKLTRPVALAGRIASLPDVPGPTDEFRTGLRAMLIAKIERDGVDAALSHDSTIRIPSRYTQALAGDGRASSALSTLRSSRTGRLRLVLLAGVTVGAIALSGVSAASTDSLPGDALYQVKRSTEQAQLALAGSDAGRGSLHLDFARLRLREATRVNPGLVGAALEDMNREVTIGVQLITLSAVAHKDPASLSTIKTFLEQQWRQLDESKAALANAGDLVASSQAQLKQVQARVENLAQALTRGCVNYGTDDLGPYPMAGC